MINLQTNLGLILLGGMLPQIENNLVINGNSNLISGAKSYRIFFVNAPADLVQINSLALQDGLAHGGAGGYSTGAGGGGRDWAGRFSSMPAT